MQKEYPTVSSDTMRLIDKKAIEEYKIPAQILMENAGKGVAFKIIEILRGNKALKDLSCTLACGAGNNGGDGLVIARYLGEHKIKPQVFIQSPKDKYNELVSLNLSRALNYKIPLQTFKQDLKSFEDAVTKSDFVVDALLGTGTSGAPRGQVADIIEIINRCKKTVFSVDIPTGLNADSGKNYSPCIKANYTLTLGLNKKGFLNPASNVYTGKVTVIDIGLPKELLLNVKDVG